MQPQSVKVTGFVDESGVFHCVRHANAGGGRLRPVSDAQNCLGCKEELEQFRRRIQRPIRLVR